MAILEDVFGGEVLAEAGLGIGVLILAPRLLGRVLRPTAKALIKSGIVLYRGAADVIDEATAAAEAGAPAPPLVSPALQARPATTREEPKAAPPERPAKRKRAAVRKSHPSKKSA